MKRIGAHMHVKYIHIRYMVNLTTSLNIKKTQFTLQLPLVIVVVVVSCLFFSRSIQHFIRQEQLNIGVS